ncbi:MAG TPA: maleylacetoacetate isomerase [Gammaproteobacteria bacterium]|nr:maleylacetoacetate isomerase [Gammaproteobacteria bacterium]
MSFTLYTYFRSSAAYRARIALNLKGIPYDAATLHLRRGEHRTARYRELNPQGLVPALEHDGSVIPQSLAIIEYLEEIHPSPPLLPAAPRDRALVRSMAQLVASEMHPLCNLRVLVYLKEELSQPEERVNTWYHHWTAEGFSSLEHMAARYSTEGRCCFGSQITMADVCLVPQMLNARRFDCDLCPYPALRAIDAALTALPAFASAHPSNQPDAE